MHRFWYGFWVSAQALLSGRKTETHGIDWESALRVLRQRLLHWVAHIGAVGESFRRGVLLYGYISVQSIKQTYQTLWFSESTHQINNRSINWLTNQAASMLNPYFWNNNEKWHNHIVSVCRCSVNQCSRCMSVRSQIDLWLSMFLYETCSCSELCLQACSLTASMFVVGKHVRCRTVHWYVIDEYLFRNAKRLGLWKKKIGWHAYRALATSFSCSRTRTRVNY